MASAEQSDGFLGHKTVDEFVQVVMGSLRSCRRLTSELQSWQQYQDYSGVSGTIGQVRAKATEIIMEIFEKRDIQMKLLGHSLPNQLDLLRDGNDALLERLHNNIDEAAGIKRQGTMDNDTSVQLMLERPSELVRREVLPRAEILRAVLEKPQNLFKIKVNNLACEPFVPMINEKPNSMKPLAVLPCIDNCGREFFSHPYEYELQHWKPNELQMVSVKPQIPLPLSETPFEFVDTKEELINLVLELKKCTEFAVDLEHHAFRTYQGLTCLLQISSRFHDYLVDPFALQREMMLLNDVFTDPKILKVFHGADMDIIWLQRDCGIYVVNMFDSHQASVVLEYPHRSLAALVLKFCGVTVDKTLQRADWRIRPLPPDFVKYARMDTHFLLFICDSLRNELIEKGNEFNNLLSAVFQRSAEICLVRYEKPQITSDSHLDMYHRSRKHFNARQLYALCELFLWRDRIAREQDESVEFVLPKHMLLQMAEVLPKEVQGILACCNPIPAMVKTERLSLHNIILQAREQPLQKVEVSSYEDHLRAVTASEDLMNKFWTRHDLSQVEEDPTDLPTLVEPRQTMLGDLFTCDRFLLVLSQSSKLFGTQKMKKIHHAKTDQFLSPYERYRQYVDKKAFWEENKEDQNVDPRSTVTTAEERLARIRDHFVALTKQSEKEEEEDAARQLLEEASIAAMEVMSGLPRAPTPEKRLDMRPPRNPREKKQKGKVVLKKQMEDAKRANRRKSSEVNIDGMIKKIRQETSADLTTSVVNVTDAVNASQPHQNGKIKLEVEPLESANECGSTSGSTFSYEDADYTVFQHKKKHVKCEGHQFEETFKSKNQKSKAFKKSGMKSFSWGNKGGFKK